MVDIVEIKLSRPGRNVSQSLLIVRARMGFWILTLERPLFGEEIAGSRGVIAAIFLRRLGM